MHARGYTRSGVSSREHDRSRRSPDGDSLDYPRGPGSRGGLRGAPVAVSAGVWWGRERRAGAAGSLVSALGCAVDRAVDRPGGGRFLGGAGSGDGGPYVGAAVHALVRGALGRLLCVPGSDLLRAGASRGAIRDRPSRRVGRDLRLRGRVVDPGRGMRGLGAHRDFPWRALGPGRGFPQECRAPRSSLAASEAVVSARRFAAAAEPAG